MERKLAVIQATSVLTIFLFVVTACISENKLAVTDNYENSPTRDKIKIDVWHWTAEPGMKPAFDAFNKSHNNIEAIFHQFPRTSSIPTKINSLLISEESIDVTAQFSPDDLRERVKNNLYLPLDDFLKENNIDYEKTFGKAITELTKIDDHYYSIPYGVNKFAVFYNKKLFDDAHVPYPKADWTWQDFMQTAKLLTNGNGSDKIYGSVIYPMDPNVGWSTLAIQTLGLNGMYKNDHETNFDHPSYKQSLQLFIDMQNKDKSIMPLAEFPAQKLDIETNRTNLFFRGKFAMFIEPTYNIWRSSLPEYKHDFEMGVVQMPRIDAQSVTVSLITFSDLSIPRNSKHPKEAFEFIKFYCLVHPDETVAPKGMMPAATLSDPKVIHAVDKLIYSAPGVDEHQSKQVFEDLNTVFVSPETTMSTAKKEILQVVKEDVTKAFLGELSVDDALKDMKKRSDELIISKNPAADMKS
ncbi:extracellular solute-binding protein [Paenibacillus sp. 1_12]|uniref:ABC transporter substrate-binding protein n=1 Tax=Paenibacillus sp. 1_12 TaxID=1566278 RepID=UPI0008F138C3|nr:extracellular solute-binding protein [Paenibacillus sp. 1_12]SFK66800.1 extracellular solute-binding protein [Paenibacillus sp. 1_12]